MPISPKSNTSADFARTEIELADLTNKVNKLATAQSQGTGTGATAQIGICSPTFIISSVQSKKGERDVMCFDPIPSASDRIEIVIGRTADTTIKSETITKTVDVDSLAQQAHHLEVEFPHELTYNTQYGLIKIKAMDIDGTVIAVNPGTNPWNGTQYTYITTWMTGNALNAPSAPLCPPVVSGVPQQVGNDVLVNQVYVDHDGGHAQVRIRAYYAANRTSTADQMQAESIGVRLKVVSDGSFIKAHTPVTNGANTFEDIEFNDLPEGLQVLVHDVWTSHGTGRVFSSVSDCPITAGAVNISAAAFATMVNGATLAFAAVDGKHSQALLTYSQPSPPFAIKKIQILRSTDGGATYQIEVPSDRPIAEGQTVSSPPALTATYLVKTKVANKGFWKVRMLARPGLDATGTTAYNSSGVADPTGDAAACDAPANLRASWEAAQVTYKWAVPTVTVASVSTPAQSVQSYNVWITSGGSFMQVLTDSGPPVVLAGKLAATQTKAGSLFVMTSRHFTVKLKVKALDPAFAGGWTINVSANNLVGGVLTEGAAASLSLAPGVDYLNATDAVNVLDVSTTVYSPGQILRNGDFLYARNASINTAKAWFSSVNGSPLPNSGAISWQIGSDNVLFTTGSGQFAQNLAERLSPGDIFAISFLARSSTNQTVTFNPSFIDGGTGSGSTTQVPSISAALSTGYNLFGAVMQLSSSAVSANPQWFNLSLNNGLGGQTVEVDRVMLVRGKQPSAFTPRVEQYETNNTGSSENPDINATSSATGSQDISNPTQGSQGQWVQPGFGIRIALTP